MATDTTRQRYLNSIVSYMLSQGRTDVPLVALAEAAGTSDRMLIYYFKTREALITEVLQTVRTRRHKDLATRLARIPRASDKVREVAAVLRWIASSEDRGNCRFFFATVGAGLRVEEPFASFLIGSIRDTFHEAQQTARRMGASSKRAEDFATIFSGLSTSLACDSLTSGETERINRAIDSAASSLIRNLELE